jgi:hypothetical protein
VERSFAEIAEKQIRRGVFRSAAASEKAIMEYLAAHNEAPKPFVWAADADMILERVKKVCERISNSGHYEVRGNRPEEAEKNSLEHRRVAARFSKVAPSLRLRWRMAVRDGRVKVSRTQVSPLWSRRNIPGGGSAETELDSPARSGLPENRVQIGCSTGPHAPASVQWALNPVAGRRGGGESSYNAEGVRFPRGPNRPPPGSNPGRVVRFRLDRSGRDVVVKGPE